MRNVLIALTAVLLGLVLAGCASRPELPSREAGNAAGVDLSGRWMLRSNPNRPNARPGERDEAIYVPPESSGRRQQTVGRSSRSGSSKGPNVHVFIETGKLLKITQTEHGLFVSFDRAIVEEFTFGENRMVSVGPIEAQRVSGWEGTVFVVETLDDRGALLTETWALDADGSELIREIRMVDNGKELYSTRKVFDRS